MPSHVRPFWTIEFSVTYAGSSKLMNGQCITGAKTEAMTRAIRAASWTRCLRLSALGYGSVVPEPEAAGLFLSKRLSLSILLFELQVPLGQFIVAERSSLVRSTLGSAHGFLEL